jgi:hypothetical protein
MWQSSCGNRQKLTDLNELIETYADSVFPIKQDVNDGSVIFSAVNSVKDDFGVLMC